MALSPAKKSAEKIFEKNCVILAVCSPFFGSKLFLRFRLFGSEKCFEDNSFSSLLNFLGGKYFKSALHAFFCIFL